MVRKSFFARLFGRSPRPDASRDRRSDRLDGPVRPDARRPLEEPEEEISFEEEENLLDIPTPEESRDGDREQTEPEAKPADGPPVSATEMSPEEEVAMRVQRGIEGLSTVLSGIDRKIDEQQRQTHELAVTVRKIPEMMKDVPETSRAGLELLARISSALESQGKATRELYERMREIPEAVQRIDEAVSERLKRVEEAEREAARKVSESVGEVRERVEHLSGETARRTEELAAELRRREEEERRRVEDLLRRNAQSTKLVVFLLAVVILVLLLVVHQMATG